MLSEKKSLAELVASRVETKFQSIRIYVDKKYPQDIVCTEAEFTSGIETIYISDYILNWLKNAESQGMQSSESVKKIDEFKLHFENNNKGCAWKFSQALIGEYVQMHRSEKNLYNRENLFSFMGAWMLRLCFGNEKKIDKDLSYELGCIMLQ